jgi:hypothetical protein
VYDVSRLRGTLVVAAAALAAGWLLSALLLASIGPRPSWLRPREDPLGWEHAGLAGRKVAGVVSECQRGEEGAGARLGVLLGRSTLREGLDPAILEKAGPPGFRWLSLYGSGGSFIYLEDPAWVLFASGLRPAVVLVAINPYMLAGRPYLTEEPCPRLGEAAADLAAGELRPAARELRETLAASGWVLTYRRLVNQRYRRALLQARLRLFRAWGLGVDALFPPDPDPWKVRLGGFPFHQTEQYRNLQLGWMRDFGWFDARSYSAGGPQAEALVRVIAGCRARGARVLLVLLPERSTLRSRVPARAAQYLRAALKEHFAADPPPVLDMRDALADELFCDQSHPNVRGRALASELLGRRLRAMLRVGGT